MMREGFDPRYGEAWTQNQCLGILSLPGVWLTIAEQGGEPAGFALTRIAADEAELLLLAVRPAMRRRGIGAALLRGIVADCRDRKAGVLHLEVRAGNGAIALYERAGFRKVGVRRDYYRGTTGEVFDAHSFSLALA
ncbi:MAG TPA: ribosomal-protein-alanine N-acetyltransferase [Sphingomonas bacterium]|uniref:[Ribosomal protein bS18]-alanine N-acetyltransferase n=1 Tax=Sphingomonas bacterium TaxID=1895847 RepID=A0A3D0W8Y0_9SPHN|nr:ribosomal-protein-alanine N-acetyltransferase [Sphingomonas bacterium]